MKVRRHDLRIKDVAFQIKNAMRALESIRKELDYDEKQMSEKMGNNESSEREKVNA